MVPVPKRCCCSAALLLLQWLVLVRSFRFIPPPGLCVANVANARAFRLVRLPLKLQSLSLLGLCCWLCCSCACYCYCCCCCSCCCSLSKELNQAKASERARKKTASENGTKPWPNRMVLEWLHLVGTHTHTPHSMCACVLVYVCKYLVFNSMYDRTFACSFVCSLAKTTHAQLPRNCQYKSRINSIKFSIFC